MKTLIIKNITREGPGILEELLDEYDMIDLNQGQTIPPLKDYDALVVFGGPDSANDTTVKMQSELEAIREALSLKMPYLGVCLGMQALVKATGGAIVQNPVREIGFRDPDGDFFSVKLTEKGKNDKLFEGVGDELEIFHLHGETVELTDNIELLGTGKFCENQVVKVGNNAYGIQGHFELTPEMFDAWLSEDPELLELDKEKLKADFSSIQDKYTKTGQQILRNFLALL